MSNYSLDEVLANPPALIGDRSNSKKVSSSTVACNTEKDRARNSLLYRWCERSSIQSFMNAVASLSLMKQQQIRQQQQLHEQIRQKMFQQVREQEEKQKEQQKQLEKEEQKVPDQNETESLKKDPTRRKVRKVVKGGVLVSIPSNMRLPPGGKTQQQVNREGEECVPFVNFKDKDGKNGSILDDILARSNSNNQEDLGELIAKPRRRTSGLNQNNNAVTSCNKDNGLLSKDSSEINSVKLVKSQTDIKDVETSTATSVTLPLCEEKFRNRIEREDLSGIKLELGKQELKIENYEDKSSSLIGNSSSQSSMNTAETLGRNEQTTLNHKNTISEVTNSGTCSVGNKGAALQHEGRNLLYSSCDKVLATSNKGDSKVNINLSFSSDTESVASGDLVIDESSDDEMGGLSSFDRMRCLNSNLGDRNAPGNTVKLCKEQSPEIGMQKESQTKANEVAESVKETMEISDEGLVEKCRQKNSQESLHLDTTSVTFKNRETVCAGLSSVRHLDSEKGFSEQEHLDDEDNSETCRNNTQTSFIDAGLNQKLPQDQTVPNSETPCNQMQGKNENLRKGQRKRSKLTDEMSPVETKRRRSERSQKDKIEPAVNSEIKTIYQGYVTRSRSQREVSASPLGHRTGTNQSKESAARVKRDSAAKSGTDLATETHPAVNSEIETTYEGYMTRSRSQREVSASPLGHRTGTNQSKESAARVKRDSAAKSGTNLASEVGSNCTLLSMVSGTEMDVTVAEQEIGQIRKRKTRGGAKKKKKKPTEWFLRQQKMAKEYAKRSAQAGVKPPPETPVCMFYQKAKCAQGAACRFKHEKTKELCRYFVSGICHKFEDGMCPNLHNEFPCMHFHKRQFCRNGDSCKFSHEPLTEDTRVMLDKYIEACIQRKEYSTQETGSPQMDQSTEYPGRSVVLNRQIKVESKAGDDKTGIPVSESSQEKPASQAVPADAGNKPTDGAGLGNMESALSSSKPIGLPKVKRLPSLSSYKPQVLFSSFASISKPPGSPSSNLHAEEKPNQSTTEGIEEAKKAFLPGMFTERR